jgi:SAM-dependent methyltransferase
MQIPIVNGSWFQAAADALIVRTPNGYLIGNARESVVVESNLEGCLTTQDAFALAALELGSCGDKYIFERPLLAQALFNWSPAEDIAYLESKFAHLKELRGLDVGCGYGRLLIQLQQRGFSIDGIDSSSPLVTTASQLLPANSGCRVFVADMAQYRSPNTYSFAFASMNSLRYASGKHHLLSHVTAMSENLVSGGLYAFNVSLNPDPRKRYRHEWLFEWNSEPHRVIWAQVDYCHLRDRLLDEIIIQREQDGAVIHREYQSQMRFTLPQLKETFRGNSDAWILDDLIVADTPSESPEGTFWLMVRRR